MALAALVHSRIAGDIKEQLFWQFSTGNTHYSLIIDTLFIFAMPLGFFS